VQAEFYEECQKMRKARLLKATVVLVLAIAVFGAGVLAGKNTFQLPHSVIHVVTVKWKAEATPEQQQAALDGVRTMAAEIPGIKNIWIKSTRVQPNDYNAAFVIEFEDKAAADRYADHPAHLAWKKIYDPIHEESRSQQITN
jgi:ABC-type glycerol-3-phosphate transport system substrate-binding protein